MNVKKYAECNYVGLGEGDYQEHIGNEGSQTWNQHPDGCFYCGSDQHHSQDCPHKDEE